MIFEREVGQKGQVVIPVDVRRLLGIKSGKKIAFEVQNEKVVLRLLQGSSEFIEDFLNVPKIRKKLTAKQLKEVFLSEHEVS